MFVNADDNNQEPFATYDYENNIWYRQNAEHECWTEIVVSAKPPEVS